jgi:HEAT repeat protein
VRSVLFTLGVLALSASAQDGPSAADFDAQLARLTPTATKEERLAVAKYCLRHFPSKHAERAVPALERLIRKDPEAEVRLEAVHALTQFAYRHKRPCPLALVEAMRDPDEQTRGWALVGAGMFKDQFEPGATKALIAGAEDDRPSVRDACLCLLPRAAPKDPKALAAIDKAKSDKEFAFRHTAYSARFHATGDLPEFLAYIIRVREEPDAVLNPLPAESVAANIQQCQRNLFLMGGAYKVAEWAEERPDDLAKALLKSLADKSPATRRGAADLIGASARRLEKTEPDPWSGAPGANWLYTLLPYTESDFKLPQPPSATRPGLIPEYVRPGAPKPEPKKIGPPPPPQPTKVAARYRELKVEARLIELRDKDPDESVRKAAKRALERLAEVAEMIPVRPREVKP